MIKFFKSHDPDNQFDVSDVLIQVSNESNLEELCETFERFLLACSYVFKGHVQIIEEDEE